MFKLLTKKEKDSIKETIRKVEEILEKRKAREKEKQDEEEQKTEVQNKDGTFRNQFDNSNLSLVKK